MRSALRALARPSGLGLQQEPSRAPFFESTCRCAAARLYGSLKPSPLREEVEHWSAAQLGRAARRALAEGDLTEALWAKYASRTEELLSELRFEEAARFASAFSTARHVDFALFAKLSARALECLPQQETEIAAQDLRRMAIACGKAQAFDSDLLEGMVPLIADRVQEFRPRELVHIADAYASQSHLARRDVKAPRADARAWPRYGSTWHLKHQDLATPEQVQNPELFALVSEALPRYLYDLTPPELASLCRSFAEAPRYHRIIRVSKRSNSFGAMECLVFLDALSRLHEGMPEELRASRKERDAEVVVGHSV
eukprot:s4751_g1.t1